MATIDLRTPEARAAFGLIDMTVYEQSHRFTQSDKYRSRAESLELIMTALLKSGEPMTRAQIARAIGRVKSPALYRMIDELADTGRIAGTVQRSRFNRLQYVYWIEGRGGRR
jgi:hypothetical protein